MSTFPYRACIVLALWLFIGYLCGAWAEGPVSFHFAQTDWSSAAVYAWMMAGPFGLIYHLFWWMVGIFVVLAVLIAAFGLRCDPDGNWTFFGYWWA